ncbi:amylo-alpha-1,6-glucosidase [Micromonospora sp. NBC_01796]|uniref:amylo-alpha-1,6-glucosidase n=1 Tax=Micromonospora sp. NBC_01796 TaxID=2975987 RepID=UPI002DDC0AFF|nr:glycogen debranching N-terminal domain-containing protein [Micromonospora sp. NBC_01796]WSA82718.1 amylo-alpha-1,6-glucosidase [Micromonospora sp. NBC_01796]
MTEPVSILDGATFVVSSRNGDIDPSPSFPTGLFALDTRFIARWELTINGEHLHSLSVDDLRYFQTSFFLAPGEPTHYIDAKASVIRKRTVGGGFEERLTVLNHQEEAVDFTVRMEIGSDFADLFEIKNLLPKRGVITTRVQDGTLRLSYRRDAFYRETVISASHEAEIDEQGMTFRIRIEPHGKWTTVLRVVTLFPSADESAAAELPTSERGRGRPDVQRRLDEWMARAPHLACDCEPLNDSYERSITDLAALRYTGLLRKEKLPAAGLPWFMTLFGRDSMITCLQTLPFIPEIAPSTLRTLADLQGTRLDNLRDEEPGKILHEIRYGESAAFEEQPHSPYYGAADSTPLFVILLDEYERWSGDTALVRELADETRLALSWIDSYGDLVGNGYIWYERRNTRNGLENQCWKDSWDAICFRDGTLPSFPRATCEIQGYAYDAKIRGARMARKFWDDPVLADRLEREAADLKMRFNRDFWVEDGEYYALALDGDGRQVDGLASNMGHLLWSGIVDEDKAPMVARHLLGPAMFSGWGVRTLAEGNGRYNPLGYHVGTVWPFDNSIIAAGLAKYGFTEESARIAESIIDAAKYFQGRLPEAFAGYDRDLTTYPVQYPTACSPQAWSAGAPLLLLRTMLGLEPQEDGLTVRPAVPASLGRIELLGIPGRWGRIDAFGRGRLRTAAQPATDDNGRDGAA